jgi:hypothetical protein
MLADLALEPALRVFELVERYHATCEALEGDAASTPKMSHRLSGDRHRNDRRGCDREQYDAQR